VPLEWISDSDARAEEAVPVKELLSARARRGSTGSASFCVGLLDGTSMFWPIEEVNDGSRS
jgi:hypothetical protein